MCAAYVPHGGSGGGDAAATVYLHSGWIPDETTHGHIGQLDSQLLQAKKVIDKKIIGQTATGN